MPRSVPPWLDSLQPVREPTLRRLSPYSTAKAWHVDVEFAAWRVPLGTSLSGSQTWNGKALIESADPKLDAGVGEVELAVRLRLAMPSRSSYWTGRPPEQWREWSLTTELRERESWLIEFDRRVRDGDEALHGNQRGWPDVVSWEFGPEDLVCVEYKGPRPSDPDVLDDVKPEQDAWFRSAANLPEFDADRYAVATWTPSAADKAILLEQSRAMVRRRSPASTIRQQRSASDAGQPQRVARDREDGLHRRKIRRALKERTGARVVSHVDGTIDVYVPPSSDVSTFRDLVEREVTRLGYSPSVGVVSSGSGGTTIRISTPETLAQHGRGAHRTS